MGCKKIFEEHIRNKDMEKLAEAFGICINTCLPSICNTCKEIASTICEEEDKGNDKGLKSPH